MVIIATIFLSFHHIKLTNLTDALENKCLLNVLRTYLVTVVSNMQNELIAFVI